MNIGSGHEYRQSRGVFLDSWGSPPLLMPNGDRRGWLFEFSDRFGPVFINRNGDISKRQPKPETHPFWKPFGIWMDSGRKCHLDAITHRALGAVYICRITTPEDEEPKQ